MWETLPINADWDCFKTPILQEILRIENLHQVEHCAFLEVIHLFQSVGSVRNKLQFRNRIRNHLFLDAGLRLDGIPALDLWDLIVLVFGNTIQTTERTGQPVVKCDKCHGPNKRSQGMFNVLNNVMLTVFPQTSNFRIKKFCCMCLRTTKQ